jgi:hypothetical protein
MLALFAFSATIETPACQVLFFPIQKAKSPLSSTERASAYN